MMVVAAYDVSEDSRRSRVAAMLQMHGDRVQKSVFVLSIDADDLAALRSSVWHGVLDLDEDSFYVFHQCADCWGTHGGLPVRAASPMPGTAGSSCEEV
jgi:CRISPR-associated protein Cas2